MTKEFNAKEMKWEPREPMNLARSDTSVVYVPHLDRIYVLGGNDGKKFYAECEYYNPVKDDWT